MVPRSGSDIDTPLVQGWSRLRHDFLLFFAASASVWLLFYGVFAAFPFVQNGADAISASKVHFLETQPAFSSGAKVRVLAFGNSKILAGFNPAVYSQAVAPDAESFNAARPANDRFLELLKRILANGTRPTHILIQAAPREDEQEAWRDYFVHDKQLVNLLFPFRNFPRDLVLFVAMSRSEGGIVNSYRERALTVEHIITDRGYYFIKGQSHFPGDRLPDDFHIATDQPSKVLPRIIDSSAPAFKELISLSTAFNFKIILIPTPYRIGEFAPPDSVERGEAKPLPSAPNFFVAGPAWWVFEPRYFSDPVHLNKEGARLYSQRLAEITAPFINTGAK